jgi:hypothetical protein
VAQAEVQQIDAAAVHLQIFKVEQKVMLDRSSSLPRH